MRRPEKIISGGQTGADQGGLEAGRILGIPTGGAAPVGFITDEGPDLDLISYGLVPGPPDPKIFPLRTIKNVRDSDGTVWFGNPSSPGGKLTLNTCRGAGKPYIVNPTPQELSQWVSANGIKTLNVAGNRERKSPGIKQQTIKTLVEAFEGLD